MQILARDFLNFNTYRCILPIILFIIHLSQEAEHQVNFCKKDYDCLDGTKHTICQLKHNCGKGPKCKQYSSMPLNSKEKKALLDIHNRLRNDQAVGKGRKSLEGRPYPTAANIREMVWDEELEFSAQCWANQCPTNHDTCRKKSGGLQVGQNLAYNSKNVIVNMVEEFYKEASKMPVALIDRFDQNYKNNVIGHFTQVVFWNSSQLGCGRSKFYFPQFKSVTVFLACNYAWAGNWGGQNVYQKGKPCSACLKGSKCHQKYKGLCTTKPSKSKVPSICKFSKDKKCKPILGNSKKGEKDEKKKENDKKDSGKQKDKKDSNNSKKDKSDKDESKKPDKDKPDKDKTKTAGNDISNTSDEDRPEGAGQDKMRISGRDCKNIDGICIIERKIIVVNSSIGYFRQLGEKFLITICICIMIQYIN